MFVCDVDKPTTAAAAAAHQLNYNYIVYMRIEVALLWYIILH